MIAILKQDVVNNYAAPRWIEVPLSKEERQEYAREHRNAKTVPDTKRIQSPVFYGRAGDRLEVFNSTNLNAFGPEGLDIFMLLSKRNEKFTVRRENLTLEL